MAEEPQERVYPRWLYHKTSGQGTIIHCLEDEARLHNQELDCWFDAMPTVQQAAPAKAENTGSVDSMQLAELEGKFAVLEQDFKNWTVNIEEHLRASLAAITTAIEELKAQAKKKTPGLPFKAPDQSTQETAA